MKQPIFIAHRGAWLPGRRENTTGAIERAVKSGRFAYIELDVRRSRSDDSATQTPIVIHDETLDRLYEQYKIPKIKRHRVGQPVSKLTIDIIRSEEIDVPTLADALKAANGHPVNLELKHSDVIDSTLSLINDLISKNNSWSHEKFVFSSFDWSILQEIKQRDDRFDVAMLYSWRNLPKTFGRTYHKLDARWITFNKWLSPVLVPIARIFNIRHRYAYSINSVLGIKVLQLFGVNGICTDILKMPDAFDKT